MYTPMDSMGKVNLMMDLISQRQRALGSNIANVDTPNYVRRIPVLNASEDISLDDKILALAKLLN